MARETFCPEGVRTRILHILSDSIPQSVRFTALPAGERRALAGVVEVERSGLLGRRKVERVPLEARNGFRKGFLDTRYAVYVTPGQDTTIAFETRHVTSRMLFLALGAVVVLGIVAGSAGIVIRWLG